MPCLIACFAWLKKMDKDRQAYIRANGYWFSVAHKKYGSIMCRGCYEGEALVDAQERWRASDDEMEAAVITKKETSI